MHPSLRAARAPAEGQVEEDCGDSCLPLIPNPSPKGEGRGADWYDLEMTTRTSPTLLAAAALLAGAGATATAITTATAAPAPTQGTACKVISEDFEKRTGSEEEGESPPSPILIAAR